MKNVDVVNVERLRCMDEVDAVCSHCSKLFAYRHCERGYHDADVKSITYCPHCGNPLIGSPIETVRPGKTR